MLLHLLTLHCLFKGSVILFFGNVFLLSHQGHMRKILLQSLVTLIWNPKDTSSVSKCRSCCGLFSHCHQPTDWLTRRTQRNLNHNVTLFRCETTSSIIPLPVLRVELVDLKNVKKKWHFTQKHTACFMLLQFCSDTGTVLTETDAWLKTCDTSRKKVTRFLLDLLQIKFPKVMLCANVSKSNIYDVST